MTTLKALNEALNTLEEILCESERSFVETDELIHEFRELFFNEEYQEKRVQVKDLAGCETVHTCQYELDEGIPAKAFRIPIIIITNNRLKRSVVIDGNHKLNTLLKHSPESEVNVIEFFFEFPKDIFPFRI